MKTDNRSMKIIVRKLIVTFSERSPSDEFQNDRFKNSECEIFIQNSYTKIKNNKRF